MKKFLVLVAIPEPSTERSESEWKQELTDSLRQVVSRLLARDDTNLLPTARNVGLIQGPEVFKYWQLSDGKNLTTVRQTLGIINKEASFKARTRKKEWSKEDLTRDVTDSRILIILMSLQTCTRVQASMLRKEELPVGKFLKYVRCIKVIEASGKP